MPTMSQTSPTNPWVTFPCSSHRKPYFTCQTRGDLHKGSQTFPTNPLVWHPNPGKPAHMEPDCIYFSTALAPEGRMSPAALAPEGGMTPTDLFLDKKQKLNSLVPIYSITRPLAVVVQWQLDMRVYQRIPNFARSNIKGIKSNSSDYTISQVADNTNIAI